MNALPNLFVADSKNPEIIVVKLQSLEDTPQALRALQERKAVILNLSRLAPEKAQRVVDWIAGGTCAIDGHTYCLGEKTFLFTPSSVHVTRSSMT
jgi:cell division inhibitor SepF